MASFNKTQLFAIFHYLWVEGYKANGMTKKDGAGNSLGTDLYGWLVDNSWTPNYTARSNPFWRSAGNFSSANLTSWVVNPHKKNIKTLSLVGMDSMTADQYTQRCQPPHPSSTSGVTPVTGAGHGATGRNMKAANFNYNGWMIKNIQSILETGKPDPEWILKATAVGEGTASWPSQFTASSKTYTLGSKLDSTVVAPTTPAPPAAEPEEDEVLITESELDYVSPETEELTILGHAEDPVRDELDDFAHDAKLKNELRLSSPEWDKMEEGDGFYPYHNEIYIMLPAATSFENEQQVCPPLLFSIDTITDQMDVEYDATKLPEQEFDAAGNPLNAFQTRNILLSIDDGGNPIEWVTCDADGKVDDDALINILSRTGETVVPTSIEVRWSDPADKSRDYSIPIGVRITTKDDTITFTESGVEGWATYADAGETDENVLVYGQPVNGIQGMPTLLRQDNYEDTEDSTGLPITAIQQAQAKRLDFYLSGGRILFLENKPKMFASIDAYAKSVDTTHFLRPVERTFDKTLDVKKQYITFYDNLFPNGNTDLFTGRNVNTPADILQSEIVFPGDEVDLRPVTEDGIVCNNVPKAKRKYPRGLVSIEYDSKDLKAGREAEYDGKDIAILSQVKLTFSDDTSVLIPDMDGRFTAEDDMNEKLAGEVSNAADGFKAVYLHNGDWADKYAELELTRKNNRLSNQYNIKDEDGDVITKNIIIRSGKGNYYAIVSTDDGLVAYKISVSM